MVEGSIPQWILTFPTTKAPRTGDGLFPGEVIEVAQVLVAEELTFLRLANNRGWTLARSPVDGSVLFEDLAGSVAEDKDVYSFPSGGRGVVPILHGPGLRTQTTVRMERIGYGLLRHLPFVAPCFPCAPLGIILRHKVPRRGE